MKTNIVEDQLNRIKEYIDINKNFIHTNIVYCFRNELLKTSLKPFLLQGNTSDIFYTELTIDEKKIYHRNSPIFIYGEYIKLSREMTQTPLRINGKLKCERSVSDFTLQIKNFYDCKEIKFIPSGREDIDVRMLGGRPFIVKVIDPQQNFFSKHIPLNLYEEVILKNMFLVKKDIKNFILCGEKTKKKIYKLLVASKKLLEIKNFYEIEQKTPLRVLHRRANLVRQRNIEILESKLINENLPNDFFYYEILIKASAGTYIKEFVHGDFGRTIPSLSTKDNLCDLVELDVQDIDKKELDQDLIISKLNK